MRQAASALLLCPEAPYPVSGGGALRTASLLEYLGRRSRLDVIVFREPGAPAPSFPPNLVRDVRVIPLPHHARHAPARVLRNIERFFWRRPPLNDRFRGFESEIARALEGRRYDVAVVEHFWCAPYVEQIAPRAGRVLLDLHNVESVFYSRLAEVEPWPASELLRAFGRSAGRLERQWLPRFSGVFVTSEADAARVAAIASSLPLFVYPNAIPLVAPPCEQAAHEVAFSGNLEYRPNISAVEYFRRRIWPLLRKRWPDLRWRIVGRHPEAIRGLVRGDSRILVEGPVEDAVAALARAEVVVVPLLAGSGTRLKLIEAWAAARPAVSTSIGAEGLPACDGEHLLIADEPAAFADAVSRLLGSPEQRARIGARGRALYERQFSWPRAWETLAHAGL